MRVEGVGLEDHGHVAASWMGAAQFLAVKQQRAAANVLPNRQSCAAMLIFHNQRAPQKQ